MGTIFTSPSPAIDDQWRAIVLFGANVASYKFALAKSLMELSPSEGDLVTLETLAVPFSRNISEHLRLADKQSTSSSSRFLDACRRFNEGNIDQDELVSESCRRGFANVIDAFHIVNRAPVPSRFFIDERKEANGLRITKDFSLLVQSQDKNILSAEVESRWRLVETAWDMGLSRTLVGIAYDEADGSLVSIDKTLRRKPVTSSRSALNGYQQGRCFYCGATLNISYGALNTDVDHFFPHILKRHGFGSLIDGIWNLVLACSSCNRGPNGKAARLPSMRLLEKLHRRNEFLILSHHPLRETIIAQTGLGTADRVDFLNQWYREAQRILMHHWEP